MLFQRSQLVLTKNAPNTPKVEKINEEPSYPYNVLYYYKNGVLFAFYRFRNNKKKTVRKHSITWF